MFEAINLTYHYGVHDVSIRVLKGQIVVLLGPNGSGKTTLFSVLCGIFAPKSGKILIDNKDVSKLELYRRVRKGLGYLPQESSVFKDLSVYDNIYMVVELIYHHKAQYSAITQSFIDDFSLNECQDRKAMSLSGGERRRLEIARCLVMEPSYLLLDEPFAGVDPIAIGQIRAILIRLKEKGIGIFMTDHNVFETLRICDYAYIMSCGRIIAEGSEHTIRHDSKVKEVYLGDHA